MTSEFTGTTSLGRFTPVSMFPNSDARTGREKRTGKGNSSHRPLDFPGSKSSLNNPRDTSNQSRSNYSDLIRKQKRTFKIRTLSIRLRLEEDGGETTVVAADPSDRVEAAETSPSRGSPIYAIAANADAWKPDLKVDVAEGLLLEGLRLAIEEEGLSKVVPPLTLRNQHATVYHEQVNKWDTKETDGVISNENFLLEDSRNLIFQAFTQSTTVFWMTKLGLQTEQTNLLMQPCQVRTVTPLWVPHCRSSLCSATETIRCKELLRALRPVSDSGIQDRLKLREHPLIQEVLQQWWLCLLHCQPEIERRRTARRDSQSNLSQVDCNPFISTFTVAAAIGHLTALLSVPFVPLWHCLQLGIDDVTRTCGTVSIHSLVSFPVFAQLLFDVADRWTVTTLPEELRLLLETSQSKLFMQDHAGIDQAGFEPSLLIPVLRHHDEVNRGAGLAVDDATGEFCRWQWCLPYRGRSEDSTVADATPIWMTFPPMLTERLNGALLAAIDSTDARPSIPPRPTEAPTVPSGPTPSAEASGSMIDPGVIEKLFSTENFFFDDGCGGMVSERGGMLFSLRQQKTKSVSAAAPQSLSTRMEGQSQQDMVLATSWLDVSVSVRRSPASQSLEGSTLPSGSVKERATSAARHRKVLGIVHRRMSDCDYDLSGVKLAPAVQPVNSSARAGSTTGDGRASHQAEADLLQELEQLTENFIAESLIRRDDLSIPSDHEETPLASREESQSPPFDESAPNPHSHDPTRNTTGNGKAESSSALTEDLDWGSQPLKGNTGGTAAAAGSGAPNAGRGVGARHWAVGIDYESISLQDHESIDRISLGLAELGLPIPSSEPGGLPRASSFHCVSNGPLPFHHHVVSGIAVADDFNSFPENDGRRSPSPNSSPSRSQSPTSSPPQSILDNATAPSQYSGWNPNNSVRHGEDLIKGIDFGGTDTDQSGTIPGNRKFEGLTPSIGGTAEGRGRGTAGNLSRSERSLRSPKLKKLRGKPELHGKAHKALEERKLLAAEHNRLLMQLQESGWKPSESDVLVEIHDCYSSISSSVSLASALKALEDGSDYSSCVDGQVLFGFITPPTSERTVPEDLSLRLYKGKQVNPRDAFDEHYQQLDSGAVQESTTRVDGEKLSTYSFDLFLECAPELDRFFRKRLLINGGLPLIRRVIRTARREATGVNPKAVPGFLALNCHLQVVIRVTAKPGDRWDEVQRAFYDSHPLGKGMFVNKYPAKSFSAALMEQLRGVTKTDGNVRRGIAPAPLGGTTPMYHPPKRLKPLSDLPQASTNPSLEGAVKHLVPMNRHFAYSLLKSSLIREKSKMEQPQRSMSALDNRSKSPTLLLTANPNLAQTTTSAGSVKGMDAVQPPSANPEFISQMDFSPNPEHAPHITAEEAYVNRMSKKASSVSPDSKHTRWFAQRLKEYSDRKLIPSSQARSLSTGMLSYDTFDEKKLLDSVPPIGPATEFRPLELRNKTKVSRFWEA